MSADLAPGAELDSASGMAVPTDQKALMARARAAARAFHVPRDREREGALGWQEALDAAPWPKSGVMAFEGEFRATFADGLVKRGLAMPAARRKDGDETGTGRRATRRLASKATMRRLVPGSREEFDEQDRKAAAAGISWSTWARRVLAGAD